MDKVEAKEILDQKIAELRALPYSELCSRLGHYEHVGVTGKFGTSYLLDIGVHWDSKRGDNLRVIVSIDDGAWRIIKRLMSDDFIIAPDGSFIDE